MIKIEKNTINTVALTLNEKSLLFASGLTPYFLFDFQNDQSKEYKRFIPIYISANTRANIFNVTESIVENLTGGTITLHSGYHTYSIYEQTSQYNLSLSATTSIVETGKALVIFPEYFVKRYNINSATTNVIYYNS